MKMFENHNIEGAFSTALLPQMAIRDWCIFLDSDEHGMMHQ